MILISLTTSTKRVWSESIHVGWVVTFTLSKHVHVTLTKVNFTSVLLQTWNQILVKAHAWVLHGWHLLLIVLRLLLTLQSLLLGCCLWLRWCTWMAWASAHHGSHALMSDLRTSSECHACCNCGHQTSASESHTTALLRCCVLLRGWSSLLWGWPGCCSCTSAWAWAATETSATAWSSSWTWSSSTSWHFKLIIIIYHNN